MKNFVKSSKIWMLALLSVLFLGVGIKAEAATLGTVTGVKQTDHSTGAIVVEWATVTGATNYQIEYCDTISFTGSSYKMDETNSPSTQKYIGNLAAGKSYYVRVTALDAAGNKGTPSTAVEFVTAPAEKVTNLKQGRVAAKSISFSWKGVTGANCYDVGYYKYNTTPQKVTFKEPTSKTTYSMKASTDSSYLIRIYPMRKSSSGYIASGTMYTDMNMSTTPRKLTGLKLYDTGSTGINSNPTATMASFSAKKLSNAADGYEYQIYGNNNKKIAQKSVEYKNIVAALPNSEKKVLEISNSKLKNNQFFKIRIRPYILVNGKKKVGSWSDYLWFAKYPNNLKAKLITNNAADGVKISWSKITGAKNYTVYVSRSRYSGYKKVGTTTSTNYTLKSFGGSPLSNGTYYYYAVANKKVGKKTYKSDDSWKGRNGFTITTRYY